MCSRQYSAAFSGGYFLDEEHAIVLVEGVQAEIALALAPGGRLHVVPRGVSAEDVWSAYHLRTASGVEVEGDFMRGVFAENQVSFMPTPTRLSLDKKSAFGPCLRAGHYQLVIESTAYRARPIDFEIKPGETTTVELELQAH